MKQAALFIGIDTYTPPIQSLICARSDAEELYQFFLQHYSPGFVKFLYDGKATANAIMEKIETLMKPLEAGDTFLLYFSGHGTQFQGKHVLVGPDSRYIGEEWTNTISMNQVNALTEKAGVRRFFIIDSCRSPLLAGARAVGNNDVQTRNVCMKAMSEEKTGTLGIIPPAILCSCSSGEQAYEIKELQHGAFTQAMLEIFREAGKWLDLSAFDKKICPKITALLKKYNLPQKQTPQ